MKRLKQLAAKTWRYFLLPLISLALILLLAGGGYTFVKRQQTARDMAINTGSGIQSLEQVTLGGSGLKSRPTAQTMSNRTNFCA
jgi:hypothetical protein